MLDAAVAGSVFTSPPVDDILAAIAVLASYKPKGILVVIINYTGKQRKIQKKFSFIFTPQKRGSHRQ